MSPYPNLTKGIYLQRDYLPTQQRTVQKRLKAFTRRTDHDLDHLDPNLPLSSCVGFV